VIVLGIDASLCNTGLAAVDFTRSGASVVATSVVRTEPSPKKRRVLVIEDDARRVAEIAAGVDAAIAKHCPVALVVEATGAGKGSKAVRGMALVFGAVVAIAKLRQLPLLQVQPLDVKRATTGQKKAEKDDVIAAVERMFPDVPWPTPASVIEHAADAVGAVLAAKDSETLRMARRLAGAA
jgi:crossover junction endodeoxyribonuclease RuvC